MKNGVVPRTFSWDIYTCIHLTSSEVLAVSYPVIRYGFPRRWPSTAAGGFGANQY